MEKKSIKYTTDGKKVVVIGDLNQTEKIVQEIFVTEDGCEVPTGERFVVKSLLDTPAISWKEKSLKELESKYETQKQYWDGKISKLDSEKRIVSKQLEAIIHNMKKTVSNNSLQKALDGIESFLLCKNIHILANDYYGYIIKEFNPESDSFFAAKYDNSYRQTEFDSLRLVSLFGKSDGDLCWKISEYSDMSGSIKDFMFFRSREECINKIQQIVDSKEAYSAKDLNAAKTFGIKLDKEKLDKYNDSLLKEKQKALSKLKLDYEKIEKEMLEIAASDI